MRHIHYFKLFVARWRSSVFSIFFAVALLPGLSRLANAQGAWQQVVSPETSTAARGNYLLYTIDPDTISAWLDHAPQEQSGKQSSCGFAIPDPFGGLVRFCMEETRLLGNIAGLEAGDIHTYTGSSRTGSARLHLTVYPGKLYGTVTDGDKTWFIETVNSSAGDNKSYVVAVFDLAGRPVTAPPVPCSKDDMETAFPGRGPDGATGYRPTGVPSAPGNLKIYRLALTCTAEYTAANGGQAQTLGNLTALVNRLNAIFERDAGVHFTLVTNNNLIFTDTATDPFPPSVGSGGQCGQNATAQSTFDTYLNSSDYDVGLAIFYLNFGGCAQGRACSGTSKGASVAGFNSTSPNSYLGEVSAHELGHKLSAGHSHNANGPNCSFAPATAWEPGGGSTIMAYSGCSPSYVSGDADIYFHGGTIGQFLQFTNSASGSCYVSGAANNTPAITTPTEDTFFIPVSTPYRLYADASDPEDNNLLYSFEQMDLGTGSTVLPSDATSFGPMVRSREPSLQSFRYIPHMDSLLAGSAYPFESLPSLSRVLTFWATVRDNHSGGGATSRDTILIRTMGNQPFIVTSQGIDTTLEAGSIIPVSWNIAGTDAAPFNVNNVRILFAADGYNYDYVLAASVPNTGSAMITVPNVSSAGGRIMVAANNNIFFNINSGDLKITVACPEVQSSTIWPQQAVTAPQGDASLALNLYPTFGAGTDTLSGEISGTSPTGNIAFKTAQDDTTGCYNGAGFGGRYDLFQFQVGQSGNYTISRTLYTITGNLFMSAYSAQGVTATTAASCNNYLHRSNAHQTPTGALVFSSFTLPAQGDSIYYLPVLRQGTSISGTFRININGPAKIFTEFKDPVNVYSYFVVNEGDTIIAATAASPDLQGLSPGNYSVYGLSHSTAFAPSAYIGTLFQTFLTTPQSAPSCALVSANFVAVTIQNNTPLPLHYLDMSARVIDHSVQLDWKILPEDVSVVERFTVLHSRDGEVFAPLAESGPGELKVTEGGYRFLHTDPVPGANFYQVKQTSKNGSITYSQVRKAYIRSKQDMVIMPNPAKGYVIIRLRDAPLPLKLTLCDLSGRKIRTYTITEVNSRLDFSFLAPGMYLLSAPPFVRKIIKE